MKKTSIQFIVLLSLLFINIINSEERRENILNYYILDLSYEQAILDLSKLINALEKSNYSFNLDTDIDTYFQDYLFQEGYLSNIFNYSKLGHTWEYSYLESFDLEFITLNNVSDKLCSNTNIIDEREQEVESVDDFIILLQKTIGEYNELCFISDNNSSIPINSLIIML